MKTPLNPSIRSALRLLATWLALAPLPLQAEPLALSELPLIGVVAAPAPNLIVAVDDSSSIGAAGLALLRSALQQAFHAHALPDGAVRLAWQSMNRCASLPAAGACAGRNALRVLDASHRTAFMAWLNTLHANGPSPAHAMLYAAGEYLRQPAGPDSPWASAPGTQQAPYLGCRRAHQLLLSDGAWNIPGGASDRWLDATPHSVLAAIGNQDGQNKVLPATLPGGSNLYDAHSPHTSVYRDAYGALQHSGPHYQSYPTLADLAFRYWSEDLQPQLANQLPPRLVAAAETVTEAGHSLALQPDWNPRNDPAVWQHLNLHTVGLLDAATLTDPLFEANGWSGADYRRLVLGQRGWPDPQLADSSSESQQPSRRAELWHAALNSRGRFIPAPSAPALAAALRNLLHDLHHEVLPGSGAQHTALTLSATTTARASQAFVAGYDPQHWSGQLTAYPVAAGSGTVGTTGHWGQDATGRPASTASVMDADTAPDFASRRRIVTSLAGHTGIDWRWALLEPQQQTALGDGDAAMGQLRMDYLAGERRHELGHPGGLLRPRQSRHGDIVHSRPWYQHGWHYRMASADPARPPMLYVGANDGMLHAFDADTGAERLAYVPRGLLGKLARLTEPGYTHHAYVDGSPFTGDVFWRDDSGSTPASARSYLAGFLGAGGRGYFVLDVTRPQHFASTPAASLVLLDQTLAADEATSGAARDIGHIFSEPVTQPANRQLAAQFARLNDGRWALLSGNGYNSANERAVLLIQYLDGARELRTLPARSGEPNGQGNGLAAPQLLDLNGDGAIDVAYAGDLKGQLWKFDLSARSPGDWHSAFGQQPLFTTLDAQPITTAPAYAHHPDGGILLLLGTGRLLTRTDRHDPQAQRVYALHDTTPFTAGRGRGGVQFDHQPSRRITAAQLVTLNVNGNGPWRLGGSRIDYQAGQRGWSFTLPLPGARVVQTAEWVSHTRFEMRFMQPAPGSTGAESCSPADAASAHYVARLDIVHGRSPNAGSDTPGNEPSPELVADPFEGLYATLVGNGEQVRTGTTRCSGPGCAAAPAPMRETVFTHTLLQPSWRQLR